MDGHITRRTFLRTAIQAGAALSVPLAFSKWDAAAFAADERPPKLILVSMDSLDPRYLYLDASGGKGGAKGNWLMPNVRSFLDHGAWFEHARCHLPAATDMNHINAVAGTDTAQHGMAMVSLQFFGFKPDGGPQFKPSSMLYARDGAGRPVDTLFKAWKRRWPLSRTFYASGKEWVADMFCVPGSGIDIKVAGKDHPSYVPDPPKAYKYYDPPHDPDAETDPESRQQKFLHYFAMERNPESFPPDAWTVDAALRTIHRERPDFGVVLLAQMDDLQHVLGAAWDPDEFVPQGTGQKGRVQSSKYNKGTVREAILDGVRDADERFGYFIRRLRAIPGYADALVVLYSDHGHINHREVDGLAGILKKSVFHTNRRNHTTNTDVIQVLGSAGLLSEEEARLAGFCPIMATSMGEIHFRGKTFGERLLKAQAAKRALLRHRVWDAFQQEWTCPWQVLDMEDTRRGLKGVCLPGELFHEHFARNNGPGELHWPDLFLFMKDHWQLPTITGYATNLGLNLPQAIADRLAPVNVFIGGHGSTDTQDIVLAFQGPGVARGRVIRDESRAEDYRISDVAVTLASLMGLELRSSTVGRDRSAKLA